MSISSINGNNSAITSTQFSGISYVNSGNQDSDGDNDGSRPSRANGGGGKFASAISQVLSQLGVSSSAATSTSDASSSSTQNPQQALASFMQNLFAALQSQDGTQATTSNGSTASTKNDGANAVAGASGQGHHHHHHDGGRMSKLEGGLQNLIQELSSSSGQSASGSSTSGSSSSNSTLDNLQQSFNSLLAADGVSGSNATLSTFLQSLSQNLQGAPATGNVVSTEA